MPVKWPWPMAYILQQVIIGSLWAFFLRVIWRECRDVRRSVKDWVMWLIFGEVRGDAGEEENKSNLSQAGGRFV